MCILSAYVCKLEVYVLIQLACIYRPMYAHVYSCPETLTKFFASISSFPFMSYAFVFTPFYVFESLFLSLIVVCL